VRDLANIERLTEMPRLLALLAAGAASLLNYSELSRSMGKRLVKSPKLILCDTGLAAHLQGVDARRLSAEPALAGPLLENFVAMELKKQVTWSEARPNLYHFRTQSGQEVDLVLEDAAGRLLAIEVKGAATVGARDFSGLHALTEATGDRFVCGIVLYAGSETVPFSERLFALPVASLWQWGATNHQ
jgi:predicted AAA+ superfamily ATPase